MTLLDGPGSAVLHQIRVLIVEDEPFIAFDILDAVEKAGGQPVGPAATVRQALAIIEANGIRAAILDVNLPDGDIGPVLDALHPGVKVVVHTGVGLPAEIKAKYPDVPVYTKPTSPTVLAARLAELIR
jgi:DNA-binding response OmpR family regulator